MRLIAEKSALRGTVAIPASKSHTIRAVAIASLAHGQSMIRNPLISSDTLSAVHCYRAFGADIDTTDPKKWLITGTAGKIATPDSPIDVGNSGTTLRIAAASAALSGTSDGIILTGDHQIQSRPISPLLGSLNDLGAAAISNNDNGKAPITVFGKINGGKTTIECITSQYLSSLLLAAPMAAGDTEIDVSLLNEPDYVQMTLDWLDKQNVDYKNDNFSHFLIKGNQKYTSFDMKIPADFSSATFFLCAGCILDSDITITGLDFTDSQPDKQVVDYLKQMSADIEVTPDGVRVKRSNLKGATIDMNRTPDALPAMAVTAAFADGPTKLINVPQARNKETDRIACMAAELKKMNLKLEELPDGIIIYPCKEAAAADFSGHADHRIVMALSLAAMAVDGKSTIDTAEAISVTFPDYVDLMKNLGAKMEIV